MKVPVRLRRLFPRSYIKWDMARLRRQQTAALRSTTLSKQERERRLADFSCEMEQLFDWRTSLDDDAILKKAAKIGVYVDEIEFSYEEDPMLNDGPYHRIETFGDRLLINEFRKPLVKMMREREPIYRKDRRENIEFLVKIITAVTGLIGTSIGLLAILRK